MGSEDHPRSDAFTDRNWWACDFPERPPDGWTAWYYKCDACVCSLKVAATRYPDAMAMPFDKEGDLGMRMKLADVTELAMALRNAYDPL